MTSIQPDGSTEFRFYRPDAKQVKIVGSFNNWQPDALSMRPLTSGWWVAQVQIAPGEHHFRYIADGNWFTDFAANGVMRNKLGWNSILIVPERRLRIGTPLKGEQDGADAIAA